MEETYYSKNKLIAYNCPSCKELYETRINEDEKHKIDEFFSKMPPGILYSYRTQHLTRDHEIHTCKIELDEQLNARRVSLEE